MPRTNSPHWFVSAQWPRATAKHKQVQILASAHRAPLSPSASAAILGVEFTADGSWSQARPLAGIYPRCLFDQGPGIGKWDKDIRSSQSGMG